MVLVDVCEPQDEQAAGLRHIAGLNEEIRRLGEEVTYWRRAAHPRTRERLVLLAKWVRPVVPIQ